MYFYKRMKRIVLCMCLIFSMEFSGTISYAAEETEGDSGNSQIEIIEKGDLENNKGEEPEGSLVEQQSENVTPDTREESMQEQAAEMPVPEDKEISEEPEKYSEEESATIGGFQITGGKIGVDYEMSSDGKQLQIKSDAFLTIKNENPNQENSVGIKVMPGVQARITLAGVNIKSAGIPLDIATNLYGTATHNAATSGDEILTPTTLYLCLADGTTNKLTPTGVTPALHCGEGSKLIIDDSVRNIDSEGNEIEPKQGRIPRDCVLMDNGKEIKKDDPLYVMESKDSGKLIVRNGEGSAGIGSGPMENAGNITINGGQVETIEIKDNYPGTGAGIGAGDGGSCTIITINGGTVTARGSYHGAGIGTGLPWGWSGWDRSQMAETIKTRNPSTTCPVGDIIINGGDIVSYAGTHGNAIGAGCPLGNNCNNSGHILKITGGNIIPIKTSQQQLGAQGTDVIVTGGSFQCTDFSGTVTDGHGSEVLMAVIDLSGSPELKNAKLKNLRVTVDGAALQEDYGLADHVDESGKLYFWLPKSATGHKVAIGDMLLVEEDGSVDDEKYDFTIPNFDPSHIIAKQYVEFKVDEDKLSEELRGKLYKQYDGVPVQGDDLIREVVDMSIPADKPEGQYLTDKDRMHFSFQQLKDQFGTEINQPIKEENTFENAGTYRLILTSNQFSENSEFANTYWGHRSYISAEITPADSVTQDVTLSGQKEGEALKGCKLQALVRPADGMATTCKAPGGTVQFYINGVPVGDPVEVKDQNKTENGYACSMAELTWDMTGCRIPARPDGKLMPTAVYNGGMNYTTSEGDGKLIENPGVPVTEPPKVEKNPEEPTEPSKPLTPDGEIESRPGETEGSLNTLHQKYQDRVEVPVSGDVLTQQQIEEWIGKRYQITSMVPDEEAAITSVTITDQDGTQIDCLDRTQPNLYHVITVVTDGLGNTSTVDLTYQIFQPEEKHPEKPEEKDPEEPTIKRPGDVVVKHPGELVDSGKPNHSGKGASTKGNSGHSPKTGDPGDMADSLCLMAVAGLLIILFWKQRKIER